MTATKKLQTTKFVRNALLGICLAIFLAVGLYFLMKSSAATNPTSRDKYVWPFSRYSPWNMPIGTEADYVDAKFTMPGEKCNGCVWFGKDISMDGDVIGFNPEDPLKDITQTDSSSWGRYPQLSGHTVIGKGHVPPDAFWEGGIHGPNNGCGTFLMEDNETYSGGQYIRIDPPGSAPSWDYTGAYKESITGAGIPGCHGGSSTNGAGYAIRIAELTGDEPIRHAMGMELYCYLYCSRDNEGHRWPALVADGYYKYPESSSCGPVGQQPSVYNGSDPGLTMGSLLALKREYDISWMTDPRAKKIAQALKDYGAYIVDDTCGDHYRFVAEGDGSGHAGAAASWWPDKEEAFHDELIKVIMELHYIANNAPNAIGGGGNPVVCYAPPFNNGTDDISTNPNGAVMEPAGCDGSGPTATPNPPTPTPTTSNPTPTPTGPTPTPNPNGNPADINSSGRVDVTDLSILIRNYKKTNATRAEGDVNGDGEVSITDLSILVKAWGT